MEYNIKKSLASVGLIFVTGLSVHSQESTILDYFNISDLKGDILLDWQISQGSTCNGIKIYRSVNNSAFVQVGEIDGICGSFSLPKRYIFKDETPVKNQVNNYRLDLGGYGNTETVGIEIIAFEARDYQIRPNPIVSTSQLLFNNEKNKEAQIHIFDAKGNAFPILTTRTNVVNINANSYNNGFYFFNVIIENQLVTSGKFIVQ